MAPGRWVGAQRAVAWHPLASCGLLQHGRSTEDKQYRMAIDEKRKEMEPLHAALGKLRNANNAAREKGVSLCSSEEELNDLIQSLHYRLQHESNTLVVKKQLLKEIKQLKGTREKVIANAALKAKIQDSLSQKEAIQDQVKVSTTLLSLDMLFKHFQSSVNEIEGRRRSVSLAPKGLVKPNEIDAEKLKEMKREEMIASGKGSSESSKRG